MTAYQIVSLVIAFLTLLGVGTYMKLLWEDKHRRKLQQTEEAKLKQQEERKQELRDALAPEIEKINTNMEKMAEQIVHINERIERLEKNLKDTLRDSILSRYYDCVHKGYRNNYDTTNILHLKEDYDELHGNSFVEDLMKRFEKLPTKEEFENNKEG